MAQAVTTLKSMKRPMKGEHGSDHAMPSTSDDKGPDYGYGLMLRLENFELDQLKMRLPKVGQQVTITAAGYVENVSESQSTHNKGDRAVGIQITDLAVAVDGQ